MNSLVACIGLIRWTQYPKSPFCASPGSWVSIKSNNQTRRQMNMLVLFEFDQVLTSKPKPVKAMASSGADDRPEEQRLADDLIALRHHEQRGQRR